MISLARRPDRLAAFRLRWQRAAGDTPVDVIAGVDTPDDPVGGCRQAHLGALDTSTGPVLVLEDDAVFRGFWLDLPAPPPGWQLLRLGGRLVTAAVPLPAPSAWQPVGAIRHTHAYVARDPAALADRIRRCGGDVAAALSFGVGGHYRLRTATVGQAAGRSDISGGDRPADDFFDQ